MLTLLQELFPNVFHSCSVLFRLPVREELWNMVGEKVENKVETDFIPDMFGIPVQYQTDQTALSPGSWQDQLHGSPVRKSQQWTFPSPNPEIETLPEFNHYKIYEIRLSNVLKYFE